MKVKVTDKCIGCGSCVAITESKIFDFNDDGLAECVIDKISEENKELVETAINNCPTGAIVNDDGLEECAVDEIKEEDKEIAKQTKDNCPTGAIEIE